MSPRLNGRELSVYLFSVAKFGGFGFREQEPKAQILKSWSNGTGRMWNAVTGVWAGTGACPYICDPTTHNPYSG